MPCVHLQKLYQLCQDHELRFQLSSSDLVRIVCRECGSHDVCPSVLTDEYDAEHPAETEERGSSQDQPSCGDRAPLWQSVSRSADH